MAYELLVFGSWLGHQARLQAPSDDEDVVIPANISRNAPCPCGSGLKYKQCHGKL